MGSSKQKYLNASCLINHEMIVRISKGQQITIPSEFRKDFGWNVGSNVELNKEGNKIVIKPLGEDLEKLFAQAKAIKPKHGMTARQMDEEVEHEILGR
jgi:AbrB family looped-hinge helix DNA binding protein